MTRYGYIRVSTKEQNPERQFEALVKYGIAKENIFTDFISGNKYSINRRKQPIGCFLFIS